MTKHVWGSMWGWGCVRYEGRVCEGRMWVGGGMCEEGV